MQQVQRIRAMQAQMAALEGASSGVDGSDGTSVEGAGACAGAASALSADGGLPSRRSASAMDAQWAAEVHLRAPDTGGLLSSAALLAASPLAASALPTGALPSQAQPHGLAHSLSGVQAPKRVSAKQLAAERRRLREAKREQIKQQAE